MFKIGLTGGICSGKTFILNIFKELGCYTVRADDISKRIIFSPQSPILEKILAVFGADIFDPRDGVNKEKFTRLLFEDPDKRLFINQLVHPLVQSERRSIIHTIGAAGVYDFFIYESALLVEAGTYKEFDKIIIACATPEDQTERLMKRDNLTQEQAETRIKSQFPLSEKLKVAHYAINTSGPFEITRNLTLETFHLLKKELKIT